MRKAYARVRRFVCRKHQTLLAVLCPPHLAEQWQEELRTKFHIDAELVLSSTVKKLERNCAIGEVDYYKECVADEHPESSYPLFTLNRDSLCHPFREEWCTSGQSHVSIDLNGGMRDFQSGGFDLRMFTAYAMFMAT